LFGQPAIDQDIKKAYQSDILSLTGSKGDFISLVGQPLGIDIKRADIPSGSILWNRQPIGAIQSASIDSGGAELRPVVAAVTSLRRTVDYVPVPYSGEIPKIQIVHVPPNEHGIHLNFISKSSPLTVSQQHISGR